MMTVWLSGTLPNRAGSRKYIQKMTISSGMPRTVLMTAMLGQLTQRWREMLSSPRISPPKKERMQETTAR